MNIIINRVLNYALEFHLTLCTKGNQKCQRLVTTTGICVIINENMDSISYTYILGVSLHAWTEILGPTVS